MKLPLPYSPAEVEKMTVNAKITARFINVFSRIQQRVFSITGKAERAAHAKSYAVLKARFTVKENLPEELAQGLFAAPGIYDAVIRLSSSAGDILPDSVSIPRGFAIKIFNPKGGDFLAENKGEKVQDFLFVSGLAFSAQPKAFLAVSSLLSLTTCRVEKLKIGLSRIGRSFAKWLRKRGFSADKLFFGIAPISPLGERMGSQTPYRYGAYSAKFDIIPASDNFRMLANELLEVDKNPQAVSEQIQDFLRQQGGKWHMRVQLRRDAKRNPLDKDDVVWPEEENPYMPVATIEVAPQDSLEKGNNVRINDEMAFSPWHGLEAHRPLGMINEIRRDVYAASAEERRKRGKCPVRTSS